jgi:hypothetical protein
MSERKGDRADFTSALREIRDRFPTAVSIELETSDQDTCGFLLRDVTMPGGVSLEETDPIGFASLAGDVWDRLSSLGWDGVVGESPEGYATVALTDND